VIELFLSVAGGRTHIGTYVGVSPSPASNENNKIKNHKNYFVIFYLEKVIHSLAEKVLYYALIWGIIKEVQGNKYFWSVYCKLI